MSALTDLFTALANKIRSNLGVSDTYTPTEMVSAIDDVYDAGENAGIASAKVGTAVAGDVLSGKTFTNSSSIGASGSMTNNGAVSPNALSAGDSYTVPAGYHNGSGVVTTQTLAAQTGVDTDKTAIDSSHVLTGYQGWVNGTKVSGSYTPSSSNIQASKSATAGTTAIDVTPDSGYDAMAKVVVSPTPSETKTDGPNVSTTKDVTPTSGKLLSKVTINPLTHSGYSPSSSSYTSITMGTSQTIDLGANHDKRYVRVQATGPSGTKDATGTPLTTNGDHTITGLSNYTGVKVNVNVPGATYDGDAAVGDVLYGKTFYSNNSTKKTGSMTNNGAVSPSALSAGGSYTIPAGYHNGSGVVSAKDLASQTGVDSGKTAIDASHVVTGYQGWVNGSKVSGTVTSKSAATYNTSTTDQTISSGQYLSGTQTIKAVTTENISAANIKQGVTVKVGDANDDDRILSVTGTYTGGGGTPTETLLWQNSAIGTDLGATTVTLSESLLNGSSPKFDYIKFVTLHNTPNNLEQNVVMKPLDEFMLCVEDGTSTNRIPALAAVNCEWNTRRIYYVSGTQIKFSGKDGSTTKTGRVMPYKIYGVKY